MSNLPELPADDGGPAFREPWEAQTFALVVSLHKAGRFTWPEWVATVAEEIRRDDPGDGTSLYRHWLAALEKIAVEKSLATDTELRVRRIECRANAQAHVHVARREPVGIG
jgi:nitrile hydratase accessory protein